jgi:hypothetical protein
LPLLNSGNLVIPRNDVLVHELVGLQRHVSTAGREIIDHRQGQHDDLANACAGAAELASEANRTPMAVFGRYGLGEPEVRKSKFDGIIESGELAGGWASST